MIEKIIETTNRIIAKAVSISTMVFGFGNAIRCAFFLDYDRFADKVFYTVMLALIGLVGLWMYNIKEDE